MRVGLLLCLLTILPFSATITVPDARANDGDVSWPSAKAHLQELVHEERCSEYWDVLWPWAKKGNLEARMNLLTLLAPPPHGTMILTPGNSGDLASRVRDIVVMAVHSDAYSESADFNKDYKELAYDLYLKQGFQENVEGKKFLECVKSNAPDCAGIAVEGKLVPSFEEYAAQIDALTGAGMKSICVSTSNK